MHRVAFVAVAVVAAAGCGSNRDAGVPPTERGHWSAYVVSPAVVGEYDTGPAIGHRSPDGKWSVAYVRRNGWGNLDVTNRTSHRTYRRYHSNDGCCSEIAWLPPHRLIFDDDYRVRILDPSVGRVVTVAHFSNFAISNNGRWIAGYADSGGHSPETVGLVPSRGGTCRVVARSDEEDDVLLGFTSDAAALRIRRSEAGGGRRIITVPLTDLKPGTGC